MTESLILFGEEEDAFLRRRADEERRRMTETGCVIRALHEDMAETYEDRLQASRTVAKEFEELASTIE